MRMPALADRGTHRAPEQRTARRHRVTILAVAILMLVSLFAAQSVSKALDRLWGPMHTHANAPAIVDMHHRHEVDVRRAANTSAASAHGDHHHHDMEGHDASVRSSTRAGVQPAKARVVGIRAASAHGRHAHERDGHHAMPPAHAHAHATPARHWHDPQEMQTLVRAGVAMLWAATPPLPPEFDVYWQLVPEPPAAHVHQRRTPAVRTAAALTVRASFDPLERPPRA